MDLRIQILDENQIVMTRVVIYQDGSDSEGTETIRRLLGLHFNLEDEGDEFPNSLFVADLTPEDE